MTLSSLTKKAASDVAFVSKREGSIRGRFVSNKRRQHHNGDSRSSLTKKASSDAAFASNKEGCIRCPFVSNKDRGFRCSFHL